MKWTLSKSSELVLLFTVYFWQNVHTCSWELYEQNNDTTFNSQMLTGEFC